ncbi:heterotrimeric G protein alpha subunit [Mycena albidolilacea]|uniref:Heterotrimeric G protein alpha subunit n=1 Tax=Mycena albidolilacea TaxID=1033008 RepID=A0AAD6ZJU0_9AGAR|nr:heterotrimeric G protein alpha subunit [Mycena albidolilacea]
MSAFTQKTNPENDPFYDFMRPPADETPAQMTARLKREADAQRISDTIDEDIKRDRAQQRKSRKELRILLLGQGESGKSTTLKNFRMQYARDAWEQERTGWRAVIQLNIIRSIILILQIMEAEMSGNGAFEGDEDEIEIIPRRHRDSNSSGADAFTDKHRMLLIRLAPLRGVEADLKRRLGAGAEPVHPSAPMSATPFDDPAPVPSPKRSPEFFVRSWTDAIDPTADHDSSTITLMTCKDDMQALWTDSAVQLALDRRKVQLSDTAGFFLDDLDRIATRSYTATDDDIVRARLRTVGIQEYLLRISDGFSLRGNDNYWTWKLYDVGGCRTMRAAWVPFFENTDVIIFLCPVSCFDERLDEDARVNRLEDSTLLWRSICSSKLLTKTQLILFLNKCDLLKRKLKRGIKVKSFLPSYGDRPNEVIPVVKYLREKYKEIQKQHSPEPRVSYIYTTTVTDTTATAKTLHSIRDRVLRENLVTSNLV